MVDSIIGGLFLIDVQRAVPLGTIDSIPMYGDGVPSGRTRRRGTVYLIALLRATSLCSVDSSPSCGKLDTNKKGIN